jgi:vacuolar-type H+-ATPase subunit H
MAKMNLLVLLDHLEELIDSKFHIAGKVLIDQDELEELIHKIRIALPQDIKEAEWVNREKDRYLLQAQEEAKRILREAESYAEKLVREDQIMDRAEEEARRIISEAKRISAEVEADARQFANQILEQLEESLDRTLKVVRKGREEF